MSWNNLADNILCGGRIDREQALAVVESPDEELLDILAAAFRVRRHYHGRTVRVHVLQNAKSGICPEDCAFCSQSSKFGSPVERYGMQSVEELVEGARKAYEMGAMTYCMVTSTRGPSSREIATVCEAVKIIKDRYPLRICTSLGILAVGQAEVLATAGVDRYNHNLEASQNFFPNICTTHDYRDRVETVRSAKKAGMEACCGGILGMGETKEDWVDLALALRELEVESVPVNLLNARPNTPLEDQTSIRAIDGLKALAMFRFVHPDRDVRIAGGREIVLGSLQPLALYAANSMFTNGYLTTPGQGPSEDMKMIEEAGFEPFIAQRPDFEPEPCELVAAETDPDA